MERFQIPLLPLLNLVFYPKIAAPITLTDKSYIQMLIASIENKHGIAVTYAKPVTSLIKREAYFPHPVAVLCIPHLISLDGGEAQFLLQGIMRIELLKMVEQSPFAIFDASTLPYPDEHKISQEEVAPLFELFNRWAHLMIQNPTDRESFLDLVATPSHLVDYISAYMINDTALKQILLEAATLKERLLLLNTLLDFKNPLEINRLSAMSIKSFETRDYSLKVA